MPQNLLFWSLKNILESPNSTSTGTTSFAKIYMLMVVSFQCPPLKLSVFPKNANFCSTLIMKGANRQRLSCLILTRESMMFPILRICPFSRRQQVCKYPQFKFLIGTPESSSMGWQVGIFFLEELTCAAKLIPLPNTFLINQLKSLSRNYTSQLSSINFHIASPIRQNRLNLIIINLIQILAIYLKKEQMQQQVNSYAFQLSQNLQKSVLESHLGEPLFYAAGRIQNKNSQSFKSILYRLHFEQQNPRKSQVKKQQLPGSVQGIHSISKDSEDLVLLMKDNSGNYSLSKTSYPLLEDETIKLETLQQFNQTRYSLINHKQTKKHFLVGESDIYTFNQEDFKRGEKLVQLEANKQITSSTIDPIHELLTYVIDGKQIIVTDKTFKKEKYALKIGTKDLSTIASIDYNPNKQYYLMSCHNEALKFWDIRKPNLPVKVFTDHHALVLNAKYNHSHDELITCSYDDGTIGLLRMNSVSSTPGQNEDTLVKLYDQHEDSVFNIKWANFSPWIFASLSYSAANIVINFVPSVQKYRILL